MYINIGIKVINNSKYKSNVSQCVNIRDLKKNKEIKSNNDIILKK